MSSHSPWPPTSSGNCQIQGTLESSWEKKWRKNQLILIWKKIFESYTWLFQHLHFPRTFRRSLGLCALTLAADISRVDLQWCKGSGQGQKLQLSHTSRCRAHGFHLSCGCFASISKGKFLLIHQGTLQMQAASVNLSLILRFLDLPVHHPSIWKGNKPQSKHQSYFCNPTLRHHTSMTWLCGSSLSPKHGTPYLYQPSLICHITTMTAQHLAHSIHWKHILNKYKDGLSTHFLYHYNISEWRTFFSLSCLLILYFLILSC